MKDAIFLTKFASKVTIIHRREYLWTDAVEVNKAKSNPEVERMISEASRWRNDDTETQCR